MLERMQQTKNEIMLYWRSRLLLLRRVAAGMRSQAFAWQAIKTAEIRIAAKRIAKRIWKR